MNSYSIRAFKSLMNTEGNFFVIGDSKLYTFMNTLVDINMVLNQWIYMIFDFVLDKLNSTTFFDTYLHEVFAVATTFYNVLLSNLGYVFVVCTLVTLLCIFFFSNPIQAIKRFLLLLVVIAVNTAIFSHGEEIVKDFNHGVDEVENVVLRTITVPMFGATGTEVNQMSMEGGNAIQTIRETYARLTIQQSFAMVNFGEVEFDQEKYGKFLYTVEEEQDAEKRKEAVKRREKEVKNLSEKNIYLTPDGFGEKFIFSLYGIANNVVVGFPLVFIQLAKFILKLFVFVLILLLPIPAILSLFPKFQSSVLHALGKIMAVLSIGAFATLAMFLLFFIMTLIDTVIFMVTKASVPVGVTLSGQLGISACLVSFLIKVITLIAIWKFKGEILSFVTGGHITVAKDQTKVPVPTIPNVGNSGASPIPPELLLALNQFNQNTKHEGESSNSTNDTDKNTRDYISDSPEVIEKEERQEKETSTHTEAYPLDEQKQENSDILRPIEQENRVTNEGDYAYPEIDNDYYTVENYENEWTEYNEQHVEVQVEDQEQIDHFYRELREIREA